MAKDKNRAGASGKSKAKSRAPVTNPEDRIDYGDGTYLWATTTSTRSFIKPAFGRLSPSFYSNLRREDDVLYSLVKSTPIELTVERLGRIAGLPFQGDDVSHYGGEDWVLNNEGLILNELGITELKRHASGRPTIHSAKPEGRLVLYIVTRILK
ncbi:unnamed protein product, partial [Cuscuta campestris]